MVDTTSVNIVRIATAVTIINLIGFSYCGIIGTYLSFDWLQFENLSF